MLTLPQSQYKRFLENLSDLLDITPSQFEKAKERYTAVGTWLSKEDSPLFKYSPVVYPQGSFRLGTVIKPITGEDEFDIDLVCNLNAKSTEITQEELKKLVGDRLKYNETYKKMLGESTRCWTLDYQDSPKFHMDILPAIPDSFGWLTESKVQFEYAKTAICITDKNSSTFSILNTNWLKSNPIGYANWFRDQMKTAFERRRRVLAENRKSSIESIKEEEVKTPLQRAIQILKRHRDIMFGDDEDKPISIIITTLAARAYAEEDNLYLALRNILDRMPNHIQTVNGKSVVTNPVNPFENFADKWQIYPKREENFRTWVVKAKEDIFEIVDKYGLDKAADNLREVFGKRVVNESIEKSGLALLSESSSIKPIISPSLLSVPYKEQPKWPLILKNEVSINARYSDGDKWHTLTQTTRVPKNKKLIFTARTNVSKPFSVFWQVVNTGEDARNANNLRGQIFAAEIWGAGGLRHTEDTQYTGTHWVECFIVKDNVCVARSNEIFVNIE